MKKGVSLIALLSTVIVLGIITSVVIVSGYDIITETEKKEFATEVLSLQKMIKERIITTGEEKIIGEKVVLDGDSNLPVNIQGLLDEMQLEPNVQAGQKELYTIKLENLGIENLRRGNKNQGQDDVYLYSKVTGKVYYKNGEKIGGNFYYTYSNDLFESVEATFEDYYPKMKELKFSEIDSGVSVAEDLDTKWKPSDLYIKLNPKLDFKYIRKYENGKYVPLSVPVQIIEYGDHKLIRVETSKLPKEEYNRKLIIGAGNHETEYEPKYLDIESPSIYLTEKNIYYVKNEGSSDLYINLKGVVDDQYSGVKIVKYAYGKKTIEYFENEGLVVKTDRIQIERNLDSTSGKLDITMYAEDNAGNKKIQYYTIPNEIVEESGI